MKILNLYAGLGGNRKQWGNEHKITAIEINVTIAHQYQSKYPLDQVRVLNVHDYLRDKKNDLNDFDFIWASPPCQSHSQMMKWYHRHSPGIRRPIPAMQDIFGLLVWLPVFYENYFCIENVQSWYQWIIPPTFKVGRHVFWSNFHVRNKVKKGHSSEHGKIGGIMRSDRITTQDERNMVDGWIGKYILDSITEKKLVDYF